MSYVTQLSYGTRKARKKHQCYDCYRFIAAGETHEFQTNKADNVYTLRQHLDCYEASQFYLKTDAFKYRDFSDGIPPLADLIAQSDEPILDLDFLRGRFPHAVCRIEFNYQIRSMQSGLDRGRQA